MNSVEIIVSDVRVRVHAQSDDLLAAASRRFNGEPAPFRETLPFGEPIRLSTSGNVAVLEHGLLKGTIDLDRAWIESPPSLVFADALVRAAVAWKLAERGAMLLHASAVSRGGAAIVAFGRSGAGKSTLATALGDALSDELVQIRRAPASGWEVWGTPWWKGSRERRPLGRLIWLVRGERPSVREVRGSELFRALTREAGVYFPIPSFQQKIFDLCADLALVGALRVAAGEGRVGHDAEMALA